MNAAAEQTAAWLEQFLAQPPAAPWLKKLRESGFRRFTELGFPTTRDEDWRFTNVTPVARTRFQAAVERPHPLPPAMGIRLVFVNGALVDRPAKLPAGMEAGRLSEHAEAVERHIARYAPFDRNPFAALNTAFVSEGAFLHVPRGAVISEPIEILHITTDGEEPRWTHPRILALAGANAQCSIVEWYVGGDGLYLTNALTEIVAGEGAVVDHYKVQQEGRRAYHVATVHASLGRSANFTSSSISLGAALARNDIDVTLSEGTDATLNGLYVVNGEQHVDHHTSLDHAKPHGTSFELYKGILDGKSSAVFNGKILVRKDAQKTDSKQTNKNLVLSDNAVIDTKPELQIFADDVRCTHGATIGQLDAESMFYLQSRGIGKKEARGLLTYAFAQDILDRVKVRPLREALERLLLEKFHERPE